jgi:hypothetical protein
MTRRSIRRKATHAGWIPVGLLAILFLAPGIGAANAASCGTDSEPRWCGGHDGYVYDAPPAVPHHQHWLGASPGGDGEAAQIAHASDAPAEHAGPSSVGAEAAGGGHAAHGGHYH